MTLTSDRPSTAALLDKIGSYSHDFAGAGLSLLNLFHGLYRTGDVPKTTAHQSPLAVVINWLGQQAINDTGCTLEVRDVPDAGYRSNAGLGFVFRITNGSGLGIGRDIIVGGDNGDITTLRSGPHGASNAAAWGDFIESIEAVACDMTRDCIQKTSADEDYKAFYAQLAAMKTDAPEHFIEDKGYQLALTQMELFLDNRRLSR